MEVVVTKSAGFCFGVRRAVEQVYEQVHKGEKVYTYGSIAHNETVVRELEEQGVTVLESRDELERLTEGTVIIRAHGISEEIYGLLEAKGLAYVDATCPFVKRIHKIVQEQSAQGRRIIIIGNDGHPEVEGAKGWTKSPATVIETPEQAQNFEAKKGEKLCIVSQTTFN